MIDIKIFISQPMRDRSDGEILLERELIKDRVSRKIVSYTGKFEIIDSFLIGCNKGVIWCLGESIKLMQDADLVIFAPGWQKARGCRIEHQICLDYSIPYLDLEEEYYPKKDIYTDIIRANINDETSILNNFSDYFSPLEIKIRED